MKTRYEHRLGARKVLRPEAADLELLAGSLLALPPSAAGHQHFGDTLDAHGEVAARFSTSTSPALVNVAAVLPRYRGGMHGSGL